MTRGALIPSEKGKAMNSRYPAMHGARWLAAFAAAVLLARPAPSPIGRAAEQPQGPAGLSKRDSGQASAKLQAASRPGQPKGKQRAKTAARPDPLAVPDGSPEQLIEYLEKLRQIQPPTKDEKAQAEFSKRAGQAALQAADKILAAKPNQDQAAYAVHVKLEVLAMLEQLGQAGAFATLQAMPGQLEKAGWPELARFVDRIVLQERLARAEASDPEQFKTVVAEIKTRLSQGPLEIEDADLALNTVFAAERIDRTGLAVQVYHQLGMIFAASKDKRLAQLGARLQGAARRLSLLGKAIQIEGFTPEGRPLDWAKYRGKVVLVVFWATGCPHCRAELVNIKKHYQAYHEKGFEVLAVSVDADKTDLVSFLAENQFPWTSLFDQALQQGDEDRTMATRYGILPIPELILVGTDGKVVSMEVRGRALGRELQRLLGPAKPPGPGHPEARAGQPQEKIGKQ